MVLKPNIFFLITFLSLSSFLFAQNIGNEYDPPTPMDPVKVNAFIHSTNDKNVQELSFNVAILDGYHIYAFVSPKEPYIQSEFGFELPKEAVVNGELETPVPMPYPGKTDLLIYSGNFEYKQKFKLDTSNKGKTNLKCWLYYQTCNAHLCLPPRKKEIKLTF